MRREIFVFSGTGNSLAVAKGLAASFGDCDLVSIPGSFECGRPAAGAPSVGLVFPLYFFGLPRVVLEFIRKVDLSGVSTLFAVVTRGGTPGCAAHLIRKILHGRNSGSAGQAGGTPALDCAFYLRFWTNYIVRHRAPSARRREAIARRADAKVRRIARAVEAGEKRACREPFRLFLVPPYRRFLATVNESDRHFFATDRCSSCGLCERICPVSNIRMEAGKPSWLHRCEQCLACLHFCPETAIEYGWRTRRKRRCSHPNARADDLVELKRRVRIEGSPFPGDRGERAPRS